MKWVLRLIIGLLLGFTPPATYVHPEFKPYVKAFEKRFDVEVDQKMSFSEDLGNEDRIGVCYPYSGDIIIRTSAWKRLSERQKAIVAYHELGHCYLGMEHDNRIIGGMPFIMNASPLVFAPRWATVDKMYMNTQHYLGYRPIRETTLDLR